MPEPQQTPSNESEAPQSAAPNPTQDADAPGAAGPSAEELLKEAQKKAEEHREAWLRALADTDNVRKRAQADVANAHKFAIENFSTALLAVKDSLEAALATDSTLESLKSGVELTLKQLNAAFEKFNLTEVNPVGQKFDPHRHQAISSVPSDAEPNSVVQVYQKGYLLNDRVIRAAMVSVAKAVEKA